MDATAQLVSQRSSEDWQDAGFVMVAPEAAATSNQQERAHSPSEFEDIAGSSVLRTPTVGESAGAVGVVSPLSSILSTSNIASTTLPGLSANATSPALFARSIASENLSGLTSIAGTDTDTDTDAFVSVAASRRSSTSLFLSVPASPGPGFLSATGPGPASSALLLPRASTQLRMTGSRACTATSEAVFATPATHGGPSVLSFETTGSFVFTPATPTLAHGSALCSGAPTPVLVSTPSPCPVRDRTLRLAEIAEEKESEESVEAGVEGGMGEALGMKKQSSESNGSTRSMSPFEPIADPTPRALNTTTTVTATASDVSVPTFLAPALSSSHSDALVVTGSSMQAGAEVHDESHSDHVVAPLMSSLPLRPAAATSLTPLLPRAAPATLAVRSARGVPRAITPALLPPPGLLNEILHSTLRSLMRSYHTAGRLLSRAAAALRRFGRWILRRRSPTSTSVAPPSTSPSQSKSSKRNSRSPPNGPSSGSACARVGAGAL